MNKLLKDAIADAKAVRETALANAKVALEEAFAPKLQSMLSHKIKEEMEETEEEGMEVEKSEDEKQMEAMQKMAGITNDEDPDSEGMKNYMEDEEEMEIDSEEEMDSEEAPEEEMEMDSEEEEAPEASEELEEAYGVIKYLRTKINEVNLLNAKLLYVNKLFRKGELTETQKVKIIETFDRAKNVREAKLIYATLSESVSNKKTKTTVAPKRKMNEGFASAPSKKTQIISESNGVYNRFKTLVEYNNKK